VEFETTIPVFERAKTVHASDCAATVTGHLDNTSENDDFKIPSFQLFTSRHTIYLPLFFNWYVDNANIKLKFFIVIQKNPSHDEPERGPCTATDGNVSDEEKYGFTVTP
jgi:hypothetical protein